ncbi:MAG: efflux transporter outer membrane subunit [Cyclobacteriaceae bacterium]|jgi:multidrug efflux system outer membrane protein|nr:efflux transporter outer membrane subunit [Flammeovirgaceae bacterium]
MKSVLLGIGVLMMVASCMVGPKYSRPTTLQPEKYVQAPTSSDSITNLKWWDVYQDTTLQRLIRGAIEANYDLKIAIARVDEAKAILGFNQANLFPFLDYRAQGRASEFRSSASQAGVGFPGNSVSLLGNVSWEIDIWGRLRHANRAAYAELVSTDETRKSVYISLVAQVAELYFQLRGLDERLAITQRTYETRKEYLRIIVLRFEKGQVSELDKLQAEQIAAAAESQLHSLERAIIITENAINVLLGRTYAPITRGLENDVQNLPVDIPSGLPSELLERRPDIRSAEQQLVAQTERVGVAVAIRFPSLSLTGFLGVASPEVSNLFSSDAFVGSVTGQLAGPIFRFNQNKRRVEGERARLQQVGFAYERTVLSAFAEVENSLAEIRTYRNEFAARQTQVTATEKSLMLSKALYDNGYTSFLQVLDAERELYNSQFEKSIALQSQLISTVRLYKALGGGW